MEDKTNDNFKYSNTYVYGIFTSYEFKKPNKYTLCYKQIGLSLFEKIVFFISPAKWHKLTIQGFTSELDEDVFITESYEEIKEFMEWNINKDNNTL